MSATASWRFTFLAILSLTLLIGILITAPNHAESFAIDDDGDVIMEDAFEQSETTTQATLDLNLNLNNESKDS